MTLYLDTSALLKLYVEEPESDACERFLTSDADWVSGEHTLVETRRNLVRLLDGHAWADAVRQFMADWRRIRIVPLDTDLCSAAASVAELSGARTLDALHIAAALRAGEPTVVTYDRRMAAAAEQSGLGTVAP